MSFDKRAFDTDDSLMLELIGWVPSTDRRKPLGVVLISPELCCAICRQQLTLRKDRPASVVVYDENLGTVPGSHFHKICRNKLCGVTQYYGYLASSPVSFFSKKSLVHTVCACSMLRHFPHFSWGIGYSRNTSVTRMT